MTPICEKMQVCRREGAGTSWPGNGGSCLQHRKYSHRTAAKFTAGIEFEYFLLDKFHLIADRFDFQKCDDSVKYRGKSGFKG